MCIILITPVTKNSLCGDHNTFLNAIRCGFKLYFNSGNYLMNKFNSRFLLIDIILSLNLLLLCSSVQSKEQKEVLFFGLHSYLPSSILLEKYTPLTEYLSKKMGVDIHIKVSSSYKDHIDHISSGKYDFSFIGPASFIKLTQNKNEYPLLGRLSFAGKNTFRGCIIIHQNSKIRTLTELKAKNFAFGDPESTLSSKVPQRLLQDAGIYLSDLKSHSHLKNHHNVALAVLMGDYDAGGIKEEVFYQYQSRGLKALQWSPDIPSHLFIARNNMNEVRINQIKNLLQELHLNPNADKILQNIKKGTIGIVPAQIEEYEQLRQMITFDSKHIH